MKNATKVREPYQLSLDRPAGRFTDKEWERELKLRIARNREYALKWALYGKKGK